MLNRLLDNSLSRFLIVGGLSTVLNYVTFYILYTFFIVNYLIASAAGFATGVFFGYWLNKTWTFRFTSSSTKLLLRKYFAVYLASLCLSLIAFHIFVKMCGINPLLANIIIISLTTCTNYIGTKILVFRR